MSMMAVGRIPHTLNYAHACMQSALIEKWKILICLENIMFFIYNFIIFLLSYSYTSRNFQCYAFRIGSHILKGDI